MVDTIADADVELDRAGYFIHPEQWNDAMAVDIASRLGIDDLTDAHWRVIRFMRERYQTHGQPPGCTMISRHCQVSKRELFELFPNRPVKMAAKIAGLPEPRSYIGGCGVNWSSRWR